MKPCPTCASTGLYQIHGHEITCPRCQGAGEVGVSEEESLAGREPPATWGEWEWAWEPPASEPLHETLYSASGEWAGELVL